MELRDEYDMFLRQEVSLLVQPRLIINLCPPPHLTFHVLSCSLAL